MVRRLNESNLLRRENIRRGKKGKLDERAYTDNFIYEAVLQSVNEKVNEIFAEYQDRYGITSGDIDPYASIELDEKMENLTDTIVEIIKYQYSMFYRKG